MYYIICFTDHFLNLLQDEPKSQRMVKLMCDDARRKLGIFLIAMITTEVFLICAIIHHEHSSAIIIGHFRKELELRMITPLPAHRARGMKKKERNYGPSESGVGRRTKKRKIQRGVKLREH